MIRLVLAELWGAAFVDESGIDSHRWESKNELLHRMDSHLR
jgi:hypothetical protein